MAEEIEQCQQSVVIWLDNTLKWHRSRTLSRVEIVYEGCGMPSLRVIQDTYSKHGGIKYILWTMDHGCYHYTIGEATQGQWLYRCVQVHHRIPGTQAMCCEEELQMEIEAQQDLGNLYMVWNPISGATNWNTANQSNGACRGVRMSVRGAT